MGGKSSTSTKLPSISSISLCSIQVKSEYAKLKETLGAVTQERDLALWERNQLQDKLENLEQVLKVREWTQIESKTLLPLKKKKCPNFFFRFGGFTCENKPLILVLASTLILLRSPPLPNTPDMSIAFQCQVGKSDQEKWARVDFSF